MKQVIWICWCWLCCITLGVQAKGTDNREVVNLNREWTYQRGDYPGAEQADYDDSGWGHIGLPHSFSIPYFMWKDFYIGYGWYRKTIWLDKADLKREISLEFDGVFQVAEVYMNGSLAATHKGGYTGFNVRLTPYVKRGENQIAVRVDNSWRGDVAPRSGEHVFSGGIYRNVRLVKKNPVHIDWYGTFVTTPTLAAHKGRSSSVRVQTDVLNLTDQAGTYELRIQVLDENRRVVSVQRDVRRVEAQNMARFDLSTDEIEGVALWHPSHPHLYSVVCSLYKGRKFLDSEEVVFGFRWFEWTADKGFFLNGEHFFFRGANVHQDQAGWGDAVTEEAMRRDVRMMKEAGFDMIRGSHYPHAPAFSDACDREGMLFWSELSFWGTAGPKVDGGWTASAYPVKEQDIEGFGRNVLRQLEEMIRIHRNHPSVFVWSMCNEPFFTDGKTIPGVRSLLKKMVDTAHRLDPTRKTAVGGTQRPLGKDRIDVIGDVAGYNGDGANIADFQQPGIPSVVTEYGSTTAGRPGKYMAGWGDLGRDEGWKGREWRSGQAIWCGFDHGSIFGENMARMGIVDYFRLPKRAWYWYRNEYGHEAPPVWPQEGVPARLRLEASKTTGILADGTDDVQLVVTVLDRDGRELSNSPDVTLSVLSGPGEFPTGRSITFSADSDIRIADGKAAMALRAYYAGHAVVEASSSGLESGRVQLEFTGAPEYEEGKSVQVLSRPYVRFTSGNVESVLQVYGSDSPTFASSSSVDHSPGFAADGDRTTYWQSAESDVSPYLALDVERTLDVYAVRVQFPPKTCQCFKVEFSVDNVEWVHVSDGVVAEGASWEKTLVQPQKARFIRFSFSSEGKEQRPALAEIEVHGKVDAR